ncbi:type VII secretion protein EccB [Kutzneria chonburiensis]|uniref:Type VII secretion protein EccB n=1 Tax=Kutzneria chonburiensis TaxID=1483604 RepID=A0ABV6N5P4_9PSEU|nr:type VII secretion protein EccB [Kutzneria chonburiensis]
MVQTQKDHVEAHSFLIGRITSALVLGNASHLDVPGRRAWHGLLIGVLLAVLIGAGFFVYGLLAHGFGTPPAAH